MDDVDAAMRRRIESAAHAVLEAACQQNLSIVTAESCTGGLLASVLTDVEGLSHAFERGFVVYTDGAKCEMLDIDPALVRRCGAVSAEIARAMARGAVTRSSGDIAISITGFAGPAAEGEEAGLVHLACATRGGALAGRELHFGDIGRDQVRSAALIEALEMLMAALAAR